MSPGDLLFVPNRSQIWSNQGELDWGDLRVVWISSRYNYDLAIASEGSAIVLVGPNVGRVAGFWVVLIGDTLYLMSTQSLEALARDPSSNPVETL